MKVKGEGGILVLRLRRKITITSRWSWRLKFWESEQLLKPERATGVPGVDSAVKSSMTYPNAQDTGFCNLTIDVCFLFCYKMLLGHGLHLFLFVL